MSKSVNSSLRPTASGIERFLGLSLLTLLGVYALGTVSSNALPTLDAVGVMSVHLALVVAALFPLAVVGHAVVGRLWSTFTRPRRVETVTATVVVILYCLAAGLQLAALLPEDAILVLYGAAVASLLVLVGLVVGR